MARGYASTQCRSWFVIAAVSELFFGERWKIACTDHQAAACTMSKLPLVADGTSNFFKLRVSIVTARDTLITPSFTHPTMSLSCQFAARSAVRSLRAAGGVRVASATLAQRRWNSTEAATNPKISTIVDQISQLTLLETADLVSTLKVRRTLCERSRWLR